MCTRVHVSRAGSGALIRITNQLFKGFQMAYAKALREQLGRLSNDMHAIINAAKNENNRGLTSEERDKFHTLESAYTNVEEDIKIAEKSDSIAARLAASSNNGQIANIINNASVDQLRDEFRTNGKKALTPKDQAFGKYLRNGLQALDASEQQHMQFISNDMPGVRNTMSTTTGSQGGYVIPQGFSDLLEEAKKWFGGIEGVVEKFPTETGNPFPWPTINDTANKGRIIGQNVQLSQTDLNFGQVSFNAYIGSSDLVLIPLALVQDSYFDLNALTARLLGTRLGRLYNWKCTVGTGTNEPTGIVTAAVAAGNILTLASGNTASISYNNLIDLEHSVDPAYRTASCRFMFNDTELKLIKKLVDGQNRPLWQPALTSSLQDGAGVIDNKPKILGYSYIINSDMASPAASANSILFGDFSAFKVREVSGGTTVLRLAERYADYLQIGFTAFQRFDSNLVDAGLHPVAVLQQSAS
jgi:HK97 family phage major capsid protein